MKKESKNRVSEIMSMFKPREGDVCFYYGRIRSGKTYSATADIIDLLNRGEIVYANWPINWKGYDERNHFSVVFIKWLTSRKNYFVYKKSNFRYFHPEDENSLKAIADCVGVHIFIDEGQWIFNSHLRNPEVWKRKLILHNGHYCRSLNIISQRPINVIPDMRSQINIWYKCEKRLSFPLVFQKTSIEDMVGDLPDEENPTGRPKMYLGSKKIFNSYNTHAMRADGAKLEFPAFDCYVVGFLDHFKLFIGLFLPRFWRVRQKRKENLKSKIKKNRKVLVL